MALRIPIPRAAASLAAGCLVAGAVGSSAQAPRTLDPITVTGTRLSDVPFEQPYALYRSGVPALARQPGATVLDRFNYGPGVFVQRTAPNQASPFVRGLTGEQSLLLLDGVRFSHAMMRPGPNQYAALVPEISLDAVDAILGSSSVVNGSDGLTGGVDFRLAPAGRGRSEPLSRWISARVDTGHGGRLSGGADGVGEAWAYSVELSGALFHDRVGGKAFRDRVFGPGAAAYDAIPNTAYDEGSAGLRLAYLGFDDRVVELKTGFTRQLDAPRPGGYAENSGDPARLYRRFDPQAFQYLHVRDVAETGFAAAERIQTTVWWHRFEERQFRASLRDAGTPAQALRRRVFDDRLDAWGLDLQATSHAGPAAAHEVIWGGTILYETTANRFREDRTPPGSLDPARLAPSGEADWANRTTVSDGSEYRTLGLFAQDHWTVTDRFRLLSGLRYSRMDWSFGSVDGGADDVTGALRGTWRATPHQRLFAGVSRAFRAPNLTNLDGAVDRGSSGDAAQGNPALDPEWSLTVEGGWKVERGRDRLAVTVFQTRIEDLIQRDFSGDGAFANIEGADLAGAEAEWEVALPFLRGDPAGHRLALVGAVSWVDAVRQIPEPDGGTVEDAISRANRLYGRTGLQFETGPHWWGRVQLRWHDAYDDVATHPSDADADDIRLTVAGDAAGRMPGYAVADLALGWRSEAGDRAVSLFVENLADKTYREPGSGIDGAGRSLGVSGSVRF